MKRFLLPFAAILLLGGGCSSGTSVDVDSSADLSRDSVLMDSTIDQAMSYELWSPELVSAGEEFVILVSLENIDSEYHFLDSIDVGISYLEGIEIEESIPPYYDRFVVGDGTYSHSYYDDIFAGETLDVYFFATALQTGSYTGALDICIDTVSDCIFRDISITVE